MLLSFVKFQIKPIKFDGMNIRSAVIFDFFISQYCSNTQHVEVEDHAIVT